MAESNMNVDITQQFQRTHFYTRTSSENVDKFYEALNLPQTLPTEPEHVENRKLDVQVDMFGDWVFRFNTPSTTSVTKVRNRKNF